MAAALGVPGYEVLQYHYTYLRPRAETGRVAVCSASSYTGVSAGAKVATHCDPDVAEA